MKAAEALVVTVTGPDATALLDSQCSQALEAVSVGESLPSLLLEPDGRFGHWILVAREDEDSWAILGASGDAGAIAERLLRFRLRERCELDTALRVLVVDDGDGWAESIAAEPPPGVPLIGGDLLEEQRIGRGRVGRADLSTGDNPFAIGPDALKASVSFTKGCYTGQELVARMDARSSSAPMQLAAIRCDEPLEPGDAVCRAGSEVGTVRSVVKAGDSWTGIAVLKRAVVEEGAQDLASCAGGAPIALRRQHG